MPTSNTKQSYNRATHTHTAWEIKDGIVVDRNDFRCSCKFGRDHVNSTQGAIFPDNPHFKIEPPTVMTNTTEQERELPDLSTYAGYVKALHDFADSLADDIDRQVKEFNLLPEQKAEITVSLIESFVNTVVQTRLKLYEARDAQREAEIRIDELKQVGIEKHLEASLPPPNPGEK